MQQNSSEKVRALSWDQMLAALLAKSPESVAAAGGVTVGDTPPTPTPRLSFPPIKSYKTNLII